MKIGIYTQPLLHNYGGILQNFALQKVLKDLGHDPITIDYDSHYLVAPLWLCFLSWVKNILLLFIPGKKSKFFKYPTYVKREQWTKDFINSHINTTTQCFRPTQEFLLKNKIDAIIVGSDQVWRPIYNKRLEDSFLGYAKKMNINRIAYAASFGSSKWEFSLIQTIRYARLAKKFHAISVRENSGIKLCQKKLNVNADFVLDPTLLLDKNQYLVLTKDIPIRKEKLLVAYILDNSSISVSQCERIAQEKNLTLVYFTAGKESSKTIPEWLSLFRDAAYIITDSFHGTVFSIIFEKKFKCIQNKSRGNARFESLLDLYNNGKLSEMQDFSRNWLKKALEV